MAFAGDNRKGTQAPVAFLDDAREQRRGRGRGRKRRHPDDEGALELSGEDCSGYALGLADSLLSTEDDSGLASSPDEILARHERASENTSAAPGVEEPQRAAADEILIALEAHHQRSEPRERGPSPRGSADLDAHQPQRPRSKASRARDQRTPLLARRRVIGAAGIATAAVGVAIAVGANSSTSASNVSDHRASASQNAPGLTLGTIEIPKLGLLAADRHHANVKPRARRRPRPAVKHVAVAHSASAPPVTASSPSTTSAPRSAGATAAAATPTYSSYPTSTSSQSTASSSAESAGPAGPGSTVGGNCNPKCS